MKHKIFAYLQLMRFPNIFTSLADVLAGYMIITTPVLIRTDILFLFLCSSCIYAAGCVLNDINDRKSDITEHPHRPIPSGRVSVKQALFFTIILYSVGLIAALYAGLKTVTVALILIALTISYDLLTKQMNIIGPINMGACRSLNLILGMSHAFTLKNNLLAFPAITLCYIFYLTILSRFEEKTTLERKTSFLFGGGFAAIIVLLYLNLNKQFIYDSLIYFVLFLAITTPPLFKELFSTQSPSLGKAVKFLILGIPVLDAFYVSGIHGWLYAVPVAFFTVISIVIARFFYVT